MWPEDSWPLVHQIPFVSKDKRAGTCETSKQHEQCVSTTQLRGCSTPQALTVWQQCHWTRGVGLPVFKHAFISQPAALSSPSSMWGTRIPLAKSKEALGAPFERNSTAWGARGTALPSGTGWKQMAPQPLGHPEFYFHFMCFIPGEHV